MSRRRSIAVLLAALLLLGGADAWAQGRGRGGPPPQPQQRGNERAAGVTLSDSVRRVERNTRGQVLSAERVPFDGREVHRVKVLDDRGRVRVFMDDPRQQRVDRERQRERDDNMRRRPPTRGDDD